MDIPETVLFERDRGVSSKLFRPLGQIPDITKNRIIKHKKATNIKATKPEPTNQPTSLQHQKILSSNTITKNLQRPNNSEKAKP